MSRLTIFSLCILVMVTVFIFVFDYSHTKNQLAITQAELETSRAETELLRAAFETTRSVTAALRAQISTSQENCAQALENTHRLPALSAPPVPEIFIMPSHTEGAGRDDLPSPAPVNTTPKANDHAFTEFLNTW